MARTANYGLEELITACRFCDLPECDYKGKTDLTRERVRERVRKIVNQRLGPAHQLSQADIDKICLDLDRHPIGYRPDSSGGDEKPRNGREFGRVVEQAFKAFRDQERDIILNAPAGACAGNPEHDIIRPGDQSTGDGKWWVGAAHLRHYLDFLLVLKGKKPCTYFSKYTRDNVKVFSTVVIDCLVPIMDQLGLWSYGFSISFMAGDWVFYDARSRRMPLVKKIFLTHQTTKELNPKAYPVDSDLGVPQEDIAKALGYPVPCSHPQNGSPVGIRDATELGVLAAAGWPEPRCCVQGTSFHCPPAPQGDIVFLEVLRFFHGCEQAAREVGTHLELFAGHYPEMTDWLADNPGMLVGPAVYMGRSGPRLDETMRLLNGWALPRPTLSLQPRRPDRNLQQQDGRGEGPGYRF